MPKYKNPKNAPTREYYIREVTEFKRRVNEKHPIEEIIEKELVRACEELYMHVGSYQLYGISYQRALGFVANDVSISLLETDVDELIEKISKTSKVLEFGRLSENGEIISVTLVKKRK